MDVSVAISVAKQKADTFTVWIALAIIFTPGGFEIESSIIAAGTADALLNSVGIFLIVSPRRSFVGY